MDNSLLTALLGNATQEQLLAPEIVMGLVFALGVWYLFRYFFYSFWLSYRLKRLTRRLRQAKALAPEQRLAELNNVFMGSKLEHAWSEYAETLHNQYEIQDGEQRLLRSRSTAGAADFFSAQSIVETPLATEFFKHLPGILTGIGIVGTFFGLMMGLQHFDPSTPERVNDSVNGLLKDVFFAFVGSFASIVASILVTFTEKFRLGRCYKNLESLTEMVDSLFDSGVGEEYLAELVRSSAESSIQTRQLKDSLVTDLREMLQNLVDTQVRESLKLADTLSTTYRDSGQMLADQVSGAIENSLKSPLEAIAGAVQTASGEQSGQVQNLLQDVLVAFMNKLEGTFGQQFNGLHEMLGQSVAAMQAMQQNFNSLIQDMRAASESSSQHNASMIGQLLTDMQAGQNAMQAGMNDMLANLQQAIARIGGEGEKAGERMAQQLEKLFAESEARQQTLAENLQAFVESIQQGVGQSQQETMNKIAESVEVLGQQLGSVFRQIEDGQAQMDAASRAAQAELHQGTRELVGGLDAQVKSLLQGVSEQQQNARHMLETLSQQTEQHWQSLQAGAEKMRVAAERFEAAGVRVGQANEATATTLGVVQGASAELTASMKEFSGLMSDYRSSRDAITKTLTVLESVIAGAQNDATARNLLIQEFKLQSERLQAVNREVTEYLDKISEVLGSGFNEFTEGMDRSLRQTLGSLDTELHKVVTSLGGEVESVREYMDDFSDIMDRIRR